MPKLLNEKQEYSFVEYINLGRASKCNVSFPEDSKLSRVHCEIIQDEQDFILIDLHSQNGTHHNGHPITEVILKNGDKINLGKQELTFIC